MAPGLTRISAAFLSCLSFISTVSNRAFHHCIACNLETRIRRTLSFLTCNGRIISRVTTSLDLFDIQGQACISKTWTLCGRPHMFKAGLRRKCYMCSWLYNVLVLRFSTSSEQIVLLRHTIVKQTFTNIHLTSHFPAVQSIHVCVAFLLRAPLAIKECQHLPL